MPHLDDPFVLQIMIAANAAALRGEKHTEAALRDLLRNVLTLRNWSPAKSAASALGAAAGSSGGAGER